MQMTDYFQLETSTLQRRGVIIAASDAEFLGGYNTDQISKTLPRNYNNSASLMTTPSPATTITAATTATPATPSSQATTGRQPGVLEYFDLDHSNPPPICNNSSTSASTSNLNTQASNSVWQPTNLAHRLSAVSISSSSVFGQQSTANDGIIGSNVLNSATIGGGVTNPPTASGIVYKSVDFIKTEAFMRTRQDAELARAKNRSKE